MCHWDVSFGTLLIDFDSGVLSRHGYGSQCATGTCHWDVLNKSKVVVQEKAKT
jgi:hypothetical protein